jgi:hypothetical protein
MLNRLRIKVKCLIGLGGGFVFKDKSVLEHSLI